LGAVRLAQLREECSYFDREHLKKTQNSVTVVAERRTSIWMADAEVAGHSLTSPGQRPVFGGKNFGLSGGRHSPAESSLDPTASRQSPLAERVSMTSGCADMHRVGNSR
jgi:hypothetical protein